MLAINNSSMVKDNRSFVIIIYKVFGYLQGLYMVDIAMFPLLSRDLHTTLQSSELFLTYATIFEE